NCLFGPFASDHRLVNSSSRRSMDQSLLEHLGRLPHEHRTDRALLRFSAAPGLAHVRRPRALALPANDLRKTPTRAGVGRTSRKIDAKRSGLVYVVHVACVSDDTGGACSDFDLQTDGVARNGTTLRHLDFLTANRLLGQQTSCGGPQT